MASDASVTVQVRDTGVPTWGPSSSCSPLLAGGFATYQWDLGERWFGSGTTPPAPDPDDRARPPYLRPRA